MQLYLVRHTEAIERSEGLAEELRHLTRRGRKQAAKQAKRLKKNRLRPGLIITSPLIRAVQTAELLAVDIGKETVVAADACLAAGADTDAVMTLLRGAANKMSIMLVGHEPQLSALAAQLLGYEHVAPLAKGSCLALSWRPDKPERPAAFDWYIEPGKKLVTSARKALLRPA
jgi:phosphohistidine phosphatase